MFNRSSNSQRSSVRARSAMSKRPPKKNLVSRCRHYVDFQSQTNVSDGEGGFTEGWANIVGATGIPVEILPIWAKRKEELRSANVKATHYIRTRVGVTVEEVGRIAWDHPVDGYRYFRIHSIEDTQERGIENFIIAEEIRD